MEQRTAGAAIVRALAAEGVRRVFGLPGGHVLSIYNALYDEPAIEHVLVRHEHTAACMASGYAQLTGEVGVCLVTAGPGATNLLTGIAEAYVGCLPIVILAGRGSTLTAQRGASQELPTDRMFAPVTKWSVRVDRPELVPEVMHQAFAIARNGRPGPVLVDLPRDVLDSELDDWPPYLPAGQRSRPRAEAAQIERAAAALMSARRPLIVAGGGVIAAAAGAGVQRLAERLGSPVLTSLAGRGCLPDDHPLAGGGLGAHSTALSKALLAEADVVLGLGTRFEEMETNWRAGALPAPAATYIQADIEAAEIGRSVPAQLAIVGDLGAIVEQLDAQLEADGQRAVGAPDTTEAAERIAAGVAELEAAVAAVLARGDQPLHPLIPIAAVRRALPRDAVIAIDVGCLAQHMVGAMPYFRVYEPRRTIVPSSFYGMGFAASALPVARIAHPEAPAVGFVGDGSFQMALQALPVAASHGLGVTWCVLDDGALGSIRDIQQYRFENRIIATEFATSPDLAMLARACGCHGERVTAPEEVDAAIARALAANAEGIPAVIDFAVARERLLGSLEHYSFYPAQLIEAAY